MSVPMRPINEWLLETNRYERPPHNDFKRWNNRIVSNLLYFQTNYFGFVIAVFLLLAFTNSQNIALGLIAIVSVASIVIFNISTDEKIKKMRHDHPIVSLVVTIFVAYYFINVFSSVLVTLFSFLLPVFLSLAHASCRLRGFANKTEQAKERLGFTSTTMGRILEKLGVDVQI